MCKRVHHKANDPYVTVCATQGTKGKMTLAHSFAISQACAKRHAERKRAK